MDLKDVAADLVGFLAEAAPDPAPAAPPVLAEEQVGEAATAVLDYVLSRMESTDSVITLGEALIIGARAAGVDLDQDDDRIAQAAVARLEDIAQAARGALHEDEEPIEEAAAPEADAIIKLLKKKKSAKLREIAKAIGGDVKAAAKTLKKLQAQGRLDYNLKTGYTVVA